MRKPTISLSLGILLVVAAPPSASGQQYCATQPDGTPCDAVAIPGNGTCIGGECRDDFDNQCDGVVCEPGRECLYGKCYASTCDTVTCTAPDSCHEPGVCVPPGICSHPVKVDGSSCDDGDASTSGDRCLSGVCRGDPAGGGLCAGVVCPSPEECELQGVCDPQTGLCTEPTRPDNAACGAPGHKCSGGACVSDICEDFGITSCAPVPDNGCYHTGRCHAATICPTLPVPDGIPCDDGDPGTSDDACLEVSSGQVECIGSALADPFDLNRATVWATRSKLGRIALDGVLPGIDPLGGLTIRVVDGLTLLVEESIGGADCRTSTQSGKTKCVTRDASVKKKKVRAVFDPQPGGVEFSIHMNKIDIDRPQDGPVMVTIEEAGGSTYEATNPNCEVFAAKLVCRN